MSINNALDRFKVIQPFLDNQTTLISISQSTRHSIRTLHRWVNQYRQHGLEGLKIKSRSDKATRRVVTKSLVGLIESLALQKPKRTKASIHRQIASYANDNHLPIPSYSTVSNIINTIPQDLISLAHDGAKSYEQQYELLFRREASKSNEIWQADHTLLDIYVIDCKGLLKRPWLTIIMDDYSRVIAGYYMSFDAPSALQTSLAFHQAIWVKKENNWPVCGIPEIMYTDHGSDFTSKHIEDVCVSLKTQLIFSSIGKPRGRGKVERFFLTVNQCLLEGLPGYTKRESKHNLTFEELDTALKKFIIDDYNHREHSSTKMTPIGKWQKNLFIPNLPEKIEQLDLLLLTVKKTRKVHRDGIRFQGYRYFSTTLASYIGESVNIRFDPRDLAEIRVFFRGEFICSAVSQELDTEVISLKEIVKARKDKRKELASVIKSSRSIVDSLINPPPTNSTPVIEVSDKKCDDSHRLKRYHNE